MPLNQIPNLSSRLYNTFFAAQELFEGLHYKGDCMGINLSIAAEFDAGKNAAWVLVNDDRIVGQEEMEMVRKALRTYLNALLPEFPLKAREVAAFLDEMS